MDIEISNLKIRNLFQLKKWSIPFGTQVLIEGPSGSGKTTLLHLIAGLMPADSGEIKVGNSILNKISENERALLRREKMGLVFQKLSLLDHMTALENIILGLHSSVDQLKKAELALAQLQISQLAKQRTSQLSLGEQQRVAVARVLAASPEIILADEPTSSLDDHNSEIVIEALLKIAQNKTLIIVSHDQRIKSYFKKTLNFTDLVKS